MRRRVARALLLVGLLMAVTGCKPSMPFRLPTLYDGSFYGSLRSEIAPDVCSGVSSVLEASAPFAIIDQPSGTYLGYAAGQVRVTFCQPADGTDVDAPGRMTFTCCNSPTGEPGTTELAGQARVVRTGSSLTVELEIEEGIGRYQSATGVCSAGGSVGDGQPDPPPPSTVVVNGDFTCRIGGPGGSHPPPAFLLTTDELPDPILAQPYEVQLAATGGTPPYTWSATGLPDGLRIEADTIVGVPVAGGQTTIEVTVRDAAGLTRSRMYSVIVQDPASAG